MGTKYEKGGKLVNIDNTPVAQSCQRDIYSFWIIKPFQIRMLAVDNQ